MDKYIKIIPDNIKRIKIDIGLSYNAPQSQNWLKYNDDLYVFGFEPNPETVECIKNGNIIKRNIYHGECIENKNLDRFCIIPVALSNVLEPTTLEFYQMLDDCGTSSLYKPIDIKLGAIKSITNVPVYSLKHFFDKFDFKRFPIIEYIKIDAQGADYDILLGAGNYLSEHVVFITAEPEYTQYENTAHNTVNNIKNYLETQGFILIKHENTNDPTFINSKYKDLYSDIYIYQS